VICYKQRKEANVIDTMELIGEVKGKNVILVDDMIDTGGTLAKAAFNDGKGACKRFVHMPFYQEMLTKNREISIIRINSYRFYSKERIKQNKSVELCTSLQKLCTWYTITIPLVESL
jgi:phosphoribosylpyrophosphate synthetase